MEWFRRWLVPELSLLLANQEKTLKGVQDMSAVVDRLKADVSKAVTDNTPAAPAA